MTERVKALIEQAKTLTAEERADLLNELSGESTEDIAKAWADEADSTQEGKKVASGLSTVAVKTLLIELKRDLTHLASIAAVALPADVAVRFSAALPPSGSGTRKPAAKTA